jgi:hypothetical protein
VEASNQKEILDAYTAWKLNLKINYFYSLKIKLIYLKFIYFLAFLVAVVILRASSGFLVMI